ncbi:MAG TPA: hypothetical protein VL404_00770, partial [Candidatus Eisenbacteria bacterium]|nr:hypothetical protein [Candidatus Eisenbacteria bacterium]
MKPRFWIVLLAAGLFYVSTMARVSGYEKEHNRYNRLAAALAAKRLDIPVEPIPAMLTDPYNFALYKDEINRQKLDDLSVYKGKIFSYFSVVPVLVLYLPYRLVTGGRDLPEQIAVFVFGFGILVWAALLWARLRDRYFPEAPAWMDAAALGFLSLSNLVPFLIPNASVYIVAILSGLFFLTGAIYFLSPAPEISVPRLELGSLFLGLAAASRPNMIPLVLLLGSLTAYRLVRRAPADLLRRLAGLSVPCFACLGMVGVYNYAR